ncbi:MAG: SPOR domain-containing protein [Pseudomonas sp.]|uniref:SPOR domain-containing protein n=1 Tax=Pseudomonas sp. TaxID=306 RepID=UPI003390C82F
MALLDKGLKQRIVGALVLVALAVIFLPMILSREDESRRVVVEAPAMPAAPSMPEVQVTPVAVPEPQLLPEEPVPLDTGEAVAATPAADSVATPAATPAVPAAPASTAKPVTTPVAQAVPNPVAVPPATPAVTAASRLDPNGLPVSWSVQLASLSSRASAEKLQKELRSQGYNAYIRSVDSMNRVFVGPLVERAEAERLRDQLTRQQKLKGFVVRFQPERG